jgi:hypothetical protein
MCCKQARLIAIWSEKNSMCDFLWTGYLIADEFPAELAAGAAYVAGFDDDGRPVLVCPAVILQCHLGNNVILPLMFLGLYPCLVATGG